MFQRKMDFKALCSKSLFVKKKFETISENPFLDIYKCPKSISHSDF